MARTRLNNLVIPGLRLTLKANEYIVVKKDGEEIEIFFTTNRTNGSKMLIFNGPKTFHVDRKVLEESELL